MLAVFVIGALASADWAPVQHLMDRFAFLPKMAFTAGTTSGRPHTSTTGGFTMSTRNVMASASKFPAALAVAGAVQAKHLGFDTPAHAVFPWWTADPADNRSAVTLRHLLTLTSGLVSDDFSSCGMPCLDISPPPLGNATKYTPEECAREIYDRGPWRASPGEVWSYHSLHLQLAGAMAAKAAKMTVGELLDTFLLRKLQMNSSFWLWQKTNPHLAAMLVSTGDDYDRLLNAALQPPAAGMRPSCYSAPSEGWIVY